MGEEARADAVSGADHYRKNGMTAERSSLPRKDTRALKIAARSNPDYKPNVEGLGAIKRYNVVQRAIKAVRTVK
jgi:hypothetical protein